MTSVTSARVTLRARRYLPLDECHRALTGAMSACQIDVALCQLAHTMDHPSSRVFVAASKNVKLGTEALSISSNERRLASCKPASSSSNRGQPVKHMSRTRCPHAGQEKIRAWDFLTSSDVTQSVAAAVATRRRLSCSWILVAVPRRHLGSWRSESQSHSHEFALFLVSAYEPISSFFPKRHSRRTLHGSPMMIYQSYWSLHLWSRPVTS